MTDEWAPVEIMDGNGKRRWLIKRGDEYGRHFPELSMFQVITSHRTRRSAQRNADKRNRDARTSQWFEVVE